MVRVFSEGVPAAANEKQVNLMRNLGGESDSPSRQLARYIAEVGRAYDPGVKPLLVFRLDRYLRGGDHYSFNQQGFAAVRFTEFRENYTRQHPERSHGERHRVRRPVEIRGLRLRLESGPAERELRLPRWRRLRRKPANVKIVTKELVNDSTLKWAAAAGTTDYEIVWRATSAPDWEHAQAIGDTTQTTMKLSKDNVIFRGPGG